MVTDSSVQYLKVRDRYRYVVPSIFGRTRRWKTGGRQVEIGGSQVVLGVWDIFRHFSRWADGEGVGVIKFDLG